MARLRGRCPKGERLFASIPHGHWRTTTFVAGLRLGGLDALFATGLEPMAPQWLTHRRSDERRNEAAGAELRFLPPYSPDFNPIENAFAKLKALLCKAAVRTPDALGDELGRLIELFAPDECGNYFIAAGYEPE